MYKYIVITRYGQDDLQKVLVEYAADGYRVAAVSGVASSFSGLCFYIVLEKIVNDKTN